VLIYVSSAELRAIPPREEVAAAPSP
jgi:hypothetical protein